MMELKLNDHTLILNEQLFVETCKARMERYEPGTRIHEINKALLTEYLEKRDGTI